MDVQHQKRQASFEGAFKQASEDVNNRYVSGTIPYTGGSHPALWQQIIVAENRLSNAWLEGQEEGFKKHLDEWVELNLRAIMIFENREAQRILL